MVLWLLVFTVSGLSTQATPTILVRLVYASLSALAFLAFRPLSLMLLLSVHGLGVRLVVLPPMILLLLLLLALSWLLVLCPTLSTLMVSVLVLAPRLVRSL